MNMLLGYAALIAGACTEAGQWLAAAHEELEWLAAWTQLGIVYLNQSRLALVQRAAEGAWHWIRLAVTRALAEEICPQILESAELVAFLLATTGAPIEAARIRRLSDQVRQIWIIPQPRSLQTWYANVMPSITVTGTEAQSADAPTALMTPLARVITTQRDGGERTVLAWDDDIVGMTLEGGGSVTYPVRSLARASFASRPCFPPQNPGRLAISE